jgi:hypothetical protein
VAGKSSPREGRLARHDRVLLSDVVRWRLQTFPLTTLTSRTVQSLPSRISWLPSTGHYCLISRASFRACNE